MATRAIITSHPEVACDVCGRRLLRGEQPDVFLSGGQRRTVCELCVPRATHEGWLRESEEHSAPLHGTASRRTRSLLGRLRQLREPGAVTSAPPPGSPPILAADREDGLYDFLDSAIAGSSPVEREAPSGSLPVPAAPRPERPARSAATSGELKVARALEVFNRGEYPRRIAGVARSLGRPLVRVAPVADSGSLVTLVVAWELSWYRYQVDLGDESAGAVLVTQGTELGDLPAEDRVANAEADEHGELSLAE